MSEESFLINEIMLRKNLINKLSSESVLDFHIELEYVDRVERLNV